MIFERDHGVAFGTWEYRLLPWHPCPWTSMASLTEGIVEGVGGGIVAAIQKSILYHCREKNNSETFLDIVVSVCMYECVYHCSCGESFIFFLNYKKNSYAGKNNYNKVITHFYTFSIASFEYLKLKNSLPCVTNDSLEYFKLISHSYTFAIASFEYLKLKTHLCMLQLLHWNISN